MKSDIHVCADWERHHDRPVYTLGETCPSCGGDAVDAAPAPFSPDDPHGEYRRRARRRARDDLRDPPVDGGGADRDTVTDDTETDGDGAATDEE